MKFEVAEVPGKAKEAQPFVGMSLFCYLTFNEELRPHPDELLHRILVDQMV